MLGFPLPSRPLNNPFHDCAIFSSHLEKQAMRISPRPVAEGSVLEPEEVDVRRRGTEGLAARLKAQIDSHKAEIFHLKKWKELYTKKYRTAKERIAELEHTVEETSRAYKEDLAKQDRRIKAMADELAQTKELLAVRSTELAGAQSFLSTKDRISEAEVLDIVRDLNENIFQVSANLTEEWEKLRSSQSKRHRISTEYIDAYSKSYGPTLVHYALRRNTPAVTYLIQSCLCDSAAEIVSSWHSKELRVLGSVYQRISASEEQAISARWRSLTHNHLSSSPSSVPIMQYAADALWITGLFASTHDSLDFVKGKASSGIETIYRLAMRLETAFMVDISSSDMRLLFEIPCTVFDQKRMATEFESDKASVPRSRDIVAGTTEVGVEKRVSGGRGEGLRQTEVLLKAKVLLDRDLAELRG